MAVRERSYPLGREMGKTFLKICLFIAPLPLFALKIEPWFAEPWEFELDSCYTYSRYRHVQNAIRPLKSPSNDHLVAFDLSVTPVFGLAADAPWNYAIDLEFAATPRQSFGFRSAGGQIRYLWLDDVSGDFASVTTGLDLRGVSHASLKDISCPYHSYANFELNTSIGKEWDRWEYWIARAFAFVGLGTANRGYPWIRAIIAGEGNHHDLFEYKVYVQSYIGLGHRKKINIDHFHGYGLIQHRSIDLGASIRYIFKIWGSLSLDYTYRVYAHSFPEHVNFFTICYRLPFSLF